MGNPSTARQVYQTFVDLLNKKKYHFDQHDNDLVISMIAQGEDLPQPTIIRVLGDRDVVQILSPIPSKIPEDKRLDAAVAVAAANYGLINGSFDLDMSDGEIRYRVAQGYRNIEFSEDLALYMLGIVFSTTDKYNDRFFMLGRGMMSLEEFIKKDAEG